MSSDLASMRADYTLAGLEESDLEPDPHAMFLRWFGEAQDAGVVEPNAMVVATASPDGRPSARAVLLKGVSEAGFVFFTNYESRKGRELDAGPHCALLFGWYQLQRQVRVEGTVRRTSREETAAYFATRPRGSQLGAWASPQSRVVASRAELDELYAAAAERFGDGEIPPPEHWGGYLVMPDVLEFWQGRSGRMHDRLRYRRSVDGGGDGWAVERLAP